MSGARLLRRLFRRPTPRLAPQDDPIGTRLRAAVDANERAELDNSRCYAERVHAMIDDLFLKMDRDAPPHR